MRKGRTIHGSPLRRRTHAYPKHTTHGPLSNHTNTHASLQSTKKTQHENTHTLVSNTHPNIHSHSNIDTRHQHHIRTLVSNTSLALSSSIFFFFSYASRSSGDSVDRSTSGAGAAGCCGPTAGPMAAAAGGLFVCCAVGG